MRDLYEDYDRSKAEKLRNDAAELFGIIFAPLALGISLFRAYYYQDMEILIDGIWDTISTFVPYIIIMKISKHKRDKWANDREKRVEQQRLSDENFENEYFKNFE